MEPFEIIKQEFSEKFNIELVVEDQRKLYRLNRQDEPIERFSRFEVRNMLDKSARELPTIRIIENSQFSKICNIFSYKHISKLYAEHHHEKIY